MADTEGRTNIVTMNGRDFEIGAPDALTLLRALKVVGRVVQRAEADAKAIGLALFDAVSGSKKKKGAQEDNLAQIVFLFIAVLEEDDLLKFAAAMLQFKDEAEGVAWLRETGVRLTPLVQAVMKNLNQLDDVIGALQVFTPSLSGLLALRQMTTQTTAQEDPTVGPVSSEPSQT